MKYINEWKNEFKKLGLESNLKKIKKNQNFKFHKIWPGDLLAFTRTGPLNSRTSPGNARVSIVLTQLADRQFSSLNLPTGSSD